MKDRTSFWRHNDFWLYDTPDVMEEIAAENGISLDGTTCFYYEAYEEEYDTKADRWLPLNLMRLARSVVAPTEAVLHGFDVVTFSCGAAPECSPLSCNSVANEVTVTADCLFRTCEEATLALESGCFRDCEPGPCRVFGVYTVVRAPTRPAPEGLVAGS